MKKKKYILIPLALLVYLGFMAYISYPGKNPELSYTQYYITIAITLVIIAILPYFLKRRDEFRNKIKNREKK